MAENAVETGPTTMREVDDDPERTDGKALAVTTPADLLRIAVESNADLDKLERLMSLQERYEANEARKAYVAAMNAFKADPPKIAKNKHVRYSTRSGPDTEYDHATLDQVCDVIGKALSQHGLSFRWETSQADDARISVTCIMTHELGHSERTTLRSMPDDSGGKNSIQAIGSATTYLQRYTLLSLTGLATVDQDDDGKKGDGGPTITDEQKAQLIALQKEVDADTSKFLAYFKVETLDELPAAQFPFAVKMLEAKRKAK